MKHLRKFQREGIRRLFEITKKRRGVLLADDMGLGKTIQALWYLKLRPFLRPAVIVCPANAKWHWLEETNDLNMRAIVLSSRTPFRRKTLDYPSITIINYEILPYWEEFLRERHPRVVIYDEAHYIKTPDAARTQSVYRLAGKANAIIAISGTPLLNRPAELFSTLHLIDPARFPSYPQFAWRYCARKKVWHRWDDRGSSHIDELHRILRRRVMIRRTKEEVLHDLPPTMQTVLPLQIERPEEYAEAERDIVSWLAKWSKVRAKRAKKSAAMVRLGYLTRLATQLKMKSMIRWLDDWLEEEEGKIVVFGIHHDMLRPLYNRYKSQAVLVDGSVTGIQRHRAVQKFQRDPHTRVFVGNLIAAGTAINLTAAKAVAMGELDWVPGAHKQAADRIRRIGQKQKTVIYYLVAKDTIEHLLCRVLQKKAEIIGRVLDGGKGQNTRLDVFTLLEKALKQRRFK